METQEIIQQIILLSLHGKINQVEEALMMVLLRMEHFDMQRQDLIQINNQFLFQKMLEYAFQVQILLKEIYFMWHKREIHFDDRTVMVLVTIIRSCKLSYRTLLKL